MITYAKENILVRATPYSDFVEMGAAGNLLTLEFQNIGRLDLADATLKVQYHPKGEWWDSSLTGNLLVKSEGGAIATLASGAKAVAILQTKGIFAMRFTFTCAGNWNTSYPNDETYLNIYGNHS